MSEQFHRRSIRLKGYDYTRAGAYYVTVCTHARLRLFGNVASGNMITNDLGTVVRRCWDAIPEHMPRVELDAFVVMPDHIHGIIVITDRMVPMGTVGATNSSPLRDHTAPTASPDGPIIPSRPRIAIMPKNSLGHIMQTFKAAVSRQAIRDGLMPRGVPIWQRGYYEHIIRDAASHDRIARYIVENPANWGRAGGPITV